MNYLCRYSVSNKCHTWSKEAHRHYLQPSVAHVALQSVPCTTHCYELDAATWPHTDVSCSLYIHCTTYMCYTLAGGDRLLTLLHCTPHEVCVCVCGVEIQQARTTCTCNTHACFLFTWILSQVMSCLCQFHLFIRWEASLEFKEWILHNHATYVFLTYFALGPNIYGMLLRPDSWKQVDC